MTSTVQQRLESWRALLRDGGPAWLVEHAPRIIRELEAELADDTPTLVHPTLEMEG